MAFVEINLGFDPGNGDTKVQSGTGRYSAPSVVSVAGMGNNTISLTSEGKTETFSCGYVSRESSTQTVASRRGKAEQIQKLYAIALSLLPEISVGDYAVNLVCSSPYYGTADQTLFRQELSKDLVLQTPTKKAKVKTNVIAVEQEGWGIVRAKSFKTISGSVIKNMNRGGVKVVELGCGTVNTSFYVDGSLVDFKTDHHGVWSLAEIVAKLAAAEYHTAFEAYEVLQAIRSPKTMKNCDGYDLTSIYKQAVGMWRDRGLANVLADALQSAEGCPVIWAGGGMLLPGLGKGLLKKHKNFYCPERASDPEFAKYAHVEGLHNASIRNIDKGIDSAHTRVA
ncbi:MAG: hypothetical protein AAFN12_16430 [Cyanobacteria bacterium J06560_2]